jgi:hypothetical protein
VEQIINEKNGGIAYLVNSSISLLLELVIIPAEIVNRLVPTSQFRFQDLMVVVCGNLPFSQLFLQALHL